MYPCRYSALVQKILLGEVKDGEVQNPLDAILCRAMVRVKKIIGSATEYLLSIVFITTMKCILGPLKIDSCICGEAPTPLWPSPGQPAGTVSFLEPDRPKIGLTRQLYLLSVVDSLCLTHNQTKQINPQNRPLSPQDCFARLCVSLAARFPCLSSFAFSN